MKRLTGSVVGISALALSLSVLSANLPASAQTNSNPANDAVQNTQQNNQPNLDTTPLQESEGDHDNWGWLGLIGLAGVYNLFRKPAQPKAYREPDMAANPGDRY